MTVRGCEGRQNAKNQCKRDEGGLTQRKSPQAVLVRQVQERA